MQSLTLEAACDALHKGRAVIFPTETFFGIGCNAMNPDAVGLVFSIKRRALDMPLPVVIAEREQLSRVAAHVPKAASDLMDRFWPGPISIVLPANPEVPDLLTANAGRIAVRLSPHPAAASLCRASGLVLVASSANISGEPSPARPEDLSPEILAGAAGVFLEGPLPSGEAPSTVVDVTESPQGPIVRVLRPGAITLEAIAEAGFAVEDASAVCRH